MGKQKNETRYLYQFRKITERIIYFWSINKVTYEIKRNYYKFTKCKLIVIIKQDAKNKK